MSRWLAQLGVLLFAAAAWSQQASVQVGPGPHYVGDPVRIRVVVEGFDEAPTPEVEVPETDAGTLSLLGVSPNVSQSISIINGQVSRTREVTHVVDLAFEARRPGRVTLGPFRVVQGSSAVRVAALDLQVGTLPTRGDVAVELVLPERPIYVGERAPVVLRLRLGRDLQRDMEGYTLRVPLFEEDRAPVLFLDPETGGGTPVHVTTDAGLLELAGEADSRGGEIVIEAPRTLVPLAAGRHEVSGATWVVSQGVAFQRDLFGGRRATRVRKWTSHGAPVVLDVKPVPTAGRPPGFGGAVGRGFSLEVAADRSVVRVGDPITLHFELRGEGIETATLPTLSSEGWFSGAHFRTPEGELVGELDGDVKRFSAVVRVADEGVVGIPELPFSWFDPETERFESTRSRPIALSVSEGQVVGAADVQRAAPLVEPSLPVRAPEIERPPALTTTADLAIERAPEVLLRNAVEGAGLLGWQGLCYAGGIGLVVLARVDRRRRDEDPDRRAQRGRLAEQCARIDAAAGLAPDEGLDQLADALRRLRAERPEADAAALEGLVAECEALRYAPGEAGLDAELVARASQAARRFVETSS